MKQFRLDALIAWLLLLIFGGLVIHAPLTVWLTAHGAPDSVKAWKEVLLVVAAVLLVWDIIRSKSYALLHDKLLWLIAGYLSLHLVTAMLSTGSLQSIITGLLIDLRYIGYAAVVLLFLRRYPSYRSSFVMVGIVGAVIVIGFAVLQTVMPRDILKYLGYSDATIKPYILLDENPEYVRINSTLRGPNPLGAYAMIVLIGVVAYTMAVGRSLKDPVKKWLYLFLAVGAAVALAVSYSRSAVLGLVAGVGVLLTVRYGRSLTRRQYTWITLIVVGFMLLMYSVRDTAFFKNIVLHDNPTTGAAYTSDQGHADSLSLGIAKMLQQPLGAGVGSTGSASLVGSAPLIIENQYLMIAHEVGWLGLGLFMTIWAWVLWRLYQHDGWVARMTLASGVGLAVIAMIWPVLTDDPVAMIWWGMAAVVLSAPTVTKRRLRGTTTNKKTA